MENCIFCRIITGQEPRSVIFESDTVLVIKDIYPRAATHFLIFPKKHYADLMDVPSDLMHMLMDTVRDLIKTHHVAKFRIVNNGGGAQQIDHVHIHLLGSVEKHREL